MWRRWRQRASAWWPIAGIGVAVVIALIAVWALTRGGAAPPTTSNSSLRLPPGASSNRPRTGAPRNGTAVEIAAGDYSSCALIQGGAVECWGDNAHGQLGDGTLVSSLAPIRVALPGPARALAVGGSHACAVLASGSVSCWGANEHGQLGNGTTGDSSSPTEVEGVHGAIAIAAGVAHTCAVLHGGTVDCWGANSNGQLGNGGTDDSPTPVVVSGLPAPARTITAGLAHTCALASTGGISCWGSNATGQLGDGLTADSLTPVPVVGLSGPAADVDAGDAHTCAVLRSGAVDCWGWNIEGQLGNGATSDSSTPIPVGGLRGAALSVSAGGSNTCAVMRSGTGVCWGANLYGQLGNGATTDSSTPVSVIGLQNGVTSLDAGLYHACALVSGAAMCWGWNDNGQLGNGTTTSSSSPVGVASLGLAPDGSGAAVATPTAIASGTTQTTLRFRYTVAPGGLHDGMISITVPLGWSLPSTKPGDDGYTTSSAGHVLTTNRTIGVGDLTLEEGNSITVTYVGGSGAAASKPGAAIWTVREQSSSAGTLSVLRRSPIIRVLSPDGSGALTTPTQMVNSGAHNAAVPFVFTAAPGGLAGGSLQLTVPTGWTAPGTTPGTPGYVTATAGMVGVSGRTIRVDGVTLRGAATLHVVYHGGRAPVTNVGSQDWKAAEQSNATGKPLPLHSSPAINVVSANGSGRLTPSTSSVSSGEKGVSLHFSYSADSGGVQNGTLQLVVPAGWSAPSTKPGDAGYVSVSGGKATVSGRTIQVPLGLLHAGDSVSLLYGATTGGGKGATAPTANVGEQQWKARESSTKGGSLKPLSSPPQVTVLSADGSGTLLRATGVPAGGSSGNTVVFLYQAAPGGLQDGSVTVAVPAGWSRPSTNALDAGYVSATQGKVSVSGRTITVSHVTLSSGAVVAIVYGSRSGGGPGATEATAPGPKLWPAAEASTADGKLQPLKG